MVHVWKGGEEVIKIEKVSVVFNRANETIKALDNISLSVKKGEWVSILGPSGSGKTTLLNVISGMAPISDGNVYFQEQDIYKYDIRDRQKFRRERIGYVFQDYRLFEQYSVLDNVVLPQLPYTKAKSELVQLAKARLEDLKMTHRINAFPNELSGGEKQRTAIARALIHKPDLLLCDEPTGNLDAENRENILHILKELNDQGITIILVTHDMEVSKWGHRELYLKDGSFIGSEVHD